MTAYKLNPLTATERVYAHIKFPRTATDTWVEKSLYNRLFIGRYNLWLIRLLVQLFPKRVVVVLYIGFQFGTFYSQEYSLRYQNTDPKVEVQRLVAYHYSSVGGHMGQLSRITTLLATVRLLGYPQAKLRFTYKVAAFTALAVEG